MAVRLGRQTPTQGHVIEYTKTLGQEAIDLYNSTTRKAQQWQELLLFDILAINDDDLYVHTKFGYSVPRRNGKNEVVTMREMFGLVRGEHIMHTAHRTSTTHTAWDRLYKLLTEAGIEITSSYRAYGKEHIEVEGGGRCEFRTRTSKGGLGEGFDLLVIDEAQEYTEDQESALKYVVSDSHNPQTIFCGTPPTAVSSGTVFPNLRDKVLSGQSENAGWAEWSVDGEVGIKDRELWYETNPSLGTILTERKIADEISGDEMDFKIQRLGFWFRINLKSAISEQEWMDLELNEELELTSKLFVGIKYGVDGTNVSMSVAVKTRNKKVFVECLDCQPIRNGNKWIIDFLKVARVEKVAVDGANGKSLLADELKREGLKAPIFPTVTEVITSSTMFEQAITDKSILHNGQTSLVQSVANCEHRAIGSNGGFGYKSIKPEIDITLMESTVLAFWLCNTTKEQAKQVIHY